MANRTDMTAVALAGATGVDTPEVPTSPRRRLVRRLAAASSRIAGLVTVVPFVPIQARVAAGAVTGVATAVDVALRQRKDRPSPMAYVAPDEKEVTADPVLFAADAASVLAATAIAATRTVASGTRRVATRQTAMVIGVVGVAVAGTVVAYRFVVRPVLRRRALRDWAASDETWASAAAETAALPSAEIEWSGFGGGSVTADAGVDRGAHLGAAGAAVAQTADAVLAADGTEMLVTEADTAIAQTVVESTEEGGSPSDASAATSEPGSDASAATQESSGDATGEAPPKKRRVRRG